MPWKARTAYTARMLLFWVGQERTACACEYRTWKQESYDLRSGWGCFGFGTYTSQGGIPDWNGRTDGRSPSVGVDRDCCPGCRAQSKSVFQFSGQIAVAAVTGAVADIDFHPEISNVKGNSVVELDMDAGTNINLLVCDQDQVNAEHDSHLKARNREPLRSFGPEERIRIQLQVVELEMHLRVWESIDGI
ncbi:hypothetical protein N7474_009493 [Penicillium riverlandense]|uniref:uncharacterized protein n=1 Tax=Penicillium riverlandense TaxID=1903569 RepID=UPI002546C664|nr:uncharacterized protein N7474_009493 [Penicillium riverlandense]KAJ5808224.1 hypothetical protein N7474_009493 [Penicillium riverlandense]